MKMIFF